MTTVVTRPVLQEGAVPTIETAAIAAYLDGNPDLGEERSWYQRDSRGPWHVREGCGSQGKTSRGGIWRKATLLAGSGRICFTCGSALLDSHASARVREGWVTAEALAHVDRDLESAKGSKDLESLGKAYAASLNALWTLEDLTPSGEYSSRTLAKLETKALSLRSSIKRKLKAQQAVVADALARAANLPEVAAALDARQPADSAAFAVVTGVVNFQEAWDENALVGAALGAWPSLVTADRIAAVALLPAGVARTLAALDLPWLSRVEIGGNCGDAEDLRTVSTLWEPSNEAGAYFSLAAAVEASRAL